MEQSLSFKMNNSTSSEDSNDSTDFEQFVKKCNSCLKYNKLVEGKAHCVVCESKKVGTCRRCKKVFSTLASFTIESERCDPCARQYIKEKQKRELKKIENQNQKNPPAKKIKFNPKENAKKPCETTILPTELKIPNAIRGEQVKAYIPIVFLNEKSTENE